MTAAEELAYYLDVPMEVDVELDSVILTVRDILHVGPGSVIRMRRSAGENLDVRIGGAVVGFGEIVVNEATTGIRLTDFKTVD
jgi:flagellar motor switch protein FliN